MPEVVHTERTRIAVDDLDGYVEMLVSIADVTTLHRFSASDAHELGIALQRRAEAVLRG